MPTITFNAFSSLQKKLKEKKIEYANAVMDIKPGLSAKDFLFQMGFNEKQVEAIFINGRIITLDTIIEDGDRVAFVPNFSSGPVTGVRKYKKGHS